MAERAPARELTWPEGARNAEYRGSDQRDALVHVTETIRDLRLWAVT